jgi:hypothetical protein
MAHKSHRKHLKHVHQHAAAEQHVEPESPSLREMASEVVHDVVEKVKEAPHAIVERVLRKPRAIVEKLTGVYSHRKGETAK